MGKIRDWSNKSDKNLFVPIDLSVLIDLLDPSVPLVPFPPSNKVTAGIHMNTDRLSVFSFIPCPRCDWWGDELRLQPEQE